MRNDISNGNDQFGCIRNFGQLKCGQKLFIGEKPDARDCESLQADVLICNWPSQVSRKHKSGYIDLKHAGKFDLANETVEGQRRYLFASTPEIRNIHIKKSPNKRQLTEHVRKLMAEARQMLQEGKSLRIFYYNNALKKLESAVELDPSSAEAYSELGYAYLKYGNGYLDRALEVLNRGIRLTSEHWLLVRLHDALGLTKSEMGDHQGSIDEFTDALRYISGKKTRARIYTHRGVSNERGGFRNDALADAKRALELWPTYDTALAVKRRLKKIDS